jgi:murein DD-endopeptidase MepM/ murein hydrolase activator NlpD
MVRHAARFIVILSLALTGALVFPETATYTIQVGETLFGIAKKVGIPLDVLCAYNGIADPSRLKAGTPIRLPQTYTIKKGDTLYSISRMYSTTLPDLLSLNMLKESSSIKAGDRLFIPVSHDNPAADTPPPTVHADPQTTVHAPPVKPPQSAAPQAAGGGTALVWPHPGRHETYQGKIPGLVFRGSRGDPVVSASSGSVEWVGPYWSWGKVVIIKGEDGLKFIYAGNEELLVNVGDRVKPGTEIAKLGVSPQEGEARLYFSIQGKDGQTVNPEKYLSQS